MPSKAITLCVLCHPIVTYTQERGGYDFLPPPDGEAEPGFKREQSNRTPYVLPLVKARWRGGWINTASISPRPHRSHQSQSVAQPNTWGTGRPGQGRLVPLPTHPVKALWMEKRGDNPRPWPLPPTAPPHPYPKGSPVCAPLLPCQPFPCPSHRGFMVLIMQTFSSSLPCCLVSSKDP